MGPVDVLREQADLVLHGVVVGVHRGLDVGRGEPEPDPAEAANEGRAAALRHRVVDRGVPVLHDAELAGLDLPRLRARREGHRHVRLPLGALREQRLRGRRRHPSDVDARDRHAVGEPVCASPRSRPRPRARTRQARPQLRPACEPGLSGLSPSSGAPVQRSSLNLAHSRSRPCYRPLSRLHLMVDATSRLSGATLRSLPASRAHTMFRPVRRTRERLREARDSSGRAINRLGLPRGLRAHRRAAADPGDGARVRRRADPAGRRRRTTSTTSSTSS